MIFSEEERVFVLEYYFGNRYFATVREAFRCMRPNKEFQITTIFGLAGEKNCGNRECLGQTTCYACDISNTRYGTNC